MGRITVDEFPEGPMFPRIDGAVAAILANGKVLAHVDELARMEQLAPAALEDWRSGLVPHLERHLPRASVTGA